MKDSLLCFPKQTWLLVLISPPHSVHLNQCFFFQSYKQKRRYIKNTTFFPHRESPHYQPWHTLHKYWCNCWSLARLSVNRGRKKDSSPHAQALIKFSQSPSDFITPPVQANTSVYTHICMYVHEQGLHPQKASSFPVVAAQAWFNFCNTFGRGPGVEVNSLLKEWGQLTHFFNNLGSTRHSPPSMFAIWLEQLWRIKFYCTALLKSRNTGMQQEHIKHYQQVLTFAMESRKNEEVSEILLCQSR